jgi:hypothetical protein
MAIYRVSLGFGQFPDGPLESFTGGIIKCMTGNAAYTDPVIPLTDLTAKVGVFHDALAAMAQGGTQATAYKNQVRAELIAMLKQLAYYVQNACNNDLSVLLSSGFQVASTNRTRLPLPQPAILLLTNPMSGQLGLRISPLANARSYEVRYQTGGGSFVAAGTFTSTRGVVVNGLTPGVVYTLQVRGVGGSTGYSDWSDPQSRMAT